MTALLLLAASVGAGGPNHLVTWRLERGHVVADAAAPAGPLAVGSLVKPFLAEAWARAHPGIAPPRAICDRESGCWKPAGHGALGLARALALSCNTYFKKIAADVPADELEGTLREEGFLVSGPVSPESALGLAGPGATPVIEPAALLRAYLRLVATPWAEGETVRRELVAGLREGARLGTARGAAGVMGKTGTVPSLRGVPLRTSGWALVFDDAGRARLGLVLDGTGREAAVALRGSPEGRGIDESGERSALDGHERQVRVLLLEALHPGAVVARHVGVDPVPTARGFLGAGATVSLRAGDRLGDTLWELRLPGSTFLRRFRGRVLVDAGREGRLRIRAEVPPDEYAAGVLLAELPDGAPELRLELAAAVLRFVAQGPRHDGADVCDLTHCAWFVGRGPQVRWPAPATPVLLREPRGERVPDERPFDAATWAHVVRRAREPGPHSWSSHCGGAPLSPHFVWGNGDRRVWSCPRHPSASSWSREWSNAALLRVFGARVHALDVGADDGVWSLRALTDRGEERLRFDDARRRVAAVIGSDALPAPATRVSRITDAFLVEGVGHGHRVGLCLAN